MNTETLPRRRLIGFALPAFISSLMFGPLAGILPTIYAKYFGLDLAVIGTVLVITRLFDGVTIGCFPDLYRALSGSPPDQVITL